MHPHPSHSQGEPGFEGGCVHYGDEDYAADVAVAAVWEGKAVESPLAARAELWCPWADRSLEMPTQGEYPMRYPEGAIIHATEGRSLAGDADMENTIRHGTGKNFAYFGISLTGKVYQTHPLDRWGHHAGPSSHPSLGSGLSTRLLGIEVAAAGMVEKTENGFEPWWNKENGAQKTYLRTDQVRFVDKGENITAAGYYMRFAPAQEDALRKLLRWLRENNPEVFRWEHVLGHDEVSPARKQDPGGALSVTMPQWRKRLEESGSPKKKGIFGFFRR